MKLYRNKLINFLSARPMGCFLLIYFFGLLAIIAQCQSIIDFDYYFLFKDFITALLALAMMLVGYSAYVGMDTMYNVKNDGQ